ncbi:MAG: hypothetical protein JXA42_24460 [Anaerolineales bacterium]|nr:hypothetical protein [Anaerolineales bacterium]
MISSENDRSAYFGWYVSVYLIEALALTEKCLEVGQDLDRIRRQCSGPSGVSF